MSDWRFQYPDISDILARKASGRVQNAARSFAAKLTILDALKERSDLFIQARKFRAAQKLQAGHEIAVHVPDAEQHEPRADVSGVAAA
jgi:hypothetical protein